MNCSIDVLNERQEDISDMLDELLIFPTRKGLQRSMDMIRSYFAQEIEVLARIGNDGISDEQYQQITCDQNQIINRGKNMSSREVLQASCCDSS